MAGNYTTVEKFDSNIHDHIASSGVIGRTHGCGCCSTEKKLTRQDLTEHITQLERDLESAKALLEFVDD